MVSGTLEVVLATETVRYLRFICEDFARPENLVQFDQSRLGDKVHADNIENMSVESMDRKFERKRLINETFELKNIQEFHLINAFPHPAVTHRLDLRIFSLHFECLDEAIAVLSIVEHIEAEIALDVSSRTVDLPSVFGDLGEERTKLILLSLTALDVKVFALEDIGDCFAFLFVWNVVGLCH